MVLGKDKIFYIERRLKNYDETCTPWNVERSWMISDEFKEVRKRNRKNLSQRSIRLIIHLGNFVKKQKEHGDKGRHLCEDLRNSHN